MGLVSPALFVLSAPSGSGKTSLVKQALEHLPFLILSVSTTTRAPRVGETEGIEYHFTNKDDFLRSVEQGEFLEWAEVYGNYYGTSKLRIEQAQAKGFSVILDIDVQGAMQLKQLSEFSAHYLFIKPPSLEELRKRLIERETETDETLEKRIGNAAHELTFQDQYDHVILNDDLAQATKEFLWFLIEQSFNIKLFTSMTIDEVLAVLPHWAQDSFVQSMLRERHAALVGLGQ